MAYATKFLQILTVILCLVGCRIFSGSNSPVSPNLERAERLNSEGKFEEAIDAYRAHMQERLAKPLRKDWENPYFYLLIIGDIQLAQGKPIEAEASFLEAEAQKVESSIVNDRLRTLASYYSKRHQYKEALQILEKYRDRDPLLFESMADRIAKKMSAEEQP